MKKSKSLISSIVAGVVILVALVATIFDIDLSSLTNTSSTNTTQATVDIAAIPNYTGSPYIEINNNVPTFTDEEKASTTSFESYSPLDDLGRVGVAYANIGQDLMPTEPRQSISSVKPTGWQSVSYDFVDGKSLYNRAHLIGFQLTGENANKENLMTGTRYLNVDGMLPFENMVAQYIKETNNHVLYRVTPYFDGDNLVANGVQIEAYSVEDNGEGIQFNVYCYNVQPGVIIDYATGNNEEEQLIEVSDNTDAEQLLTQDYVVNINNSKVHLPECSSVAAMSESNKQVVNLTREEVLASYTPCSICNP